MASSIWGSTFDGEGVDIDKTRAIELFEKSAAGRIDAKYELGRILVSRDEFGSRYHSGSGVTETSHSWMKMSRNLKGVCHCLRKPLKKEMPKRRFSSTAYSPARSSILEIRAWQIKIEAWSLEKAARKKHTFSMGLLGQFHLFAVRFLWKGILSKELLFFS